MEASLSLSSSLPLPPLATGSSAPRKVAARRWRLAGTGSASSASSSSSSPLPSSSLSPPPKMRMLERCSFSLSASAAPCSPRTICTPAVSTASSRAPSSPGSARVKFTVWSAMLTYMASLS